jgi:hypothetical protein
MRRTVLAVLAVAVIAAGCSGSSSHDPSVQNDNADADASFRQVDDHPPRVPVDTNIYVVRGQVIGEPDSLTRQTAPAQASVSGYFAGGSGFVSGAAFGPRFAGKGFVRVRVASVTPKAPFFSVGETVLVKTSDTKAAALLPADVVEFKCRAQYEAVAPIGHNERFAADRYGTWELDFCRLATPSLGAPQR